MNEDRLQPNEERLNALSHALGAFGAVLGLLFLLDRNDCKTISETASILIYGISLISMFTVSAAYHWVANPELKKTLRIADHINIYFLIAGTYTPVALIALGDDNGWALFLKVWSIAIFGTFFKLFYTGKFEFISLLLYLVMGWLIVFDFDQLAEGTSKLGLGFLMMGGVFYTLGIIFYAWQRIPYHHFIWHLFVLAGAISHWVFIYIDVV